MRTLIEMAHEVYGEHTFWTEAQLLRLKELERLVRADEREACAKKTPTTVTTGHCKEKAKTGGCQLHNIQCGFPACDRKES
jgi:hypothetical protein